MLLRDQGEDAVSAVCEPSDCSAGRRQGRGYGRRTLGASSQGWHRGSTMSVPLSRLFLGPWLRACLELQDHVGSIERGRGGKACRARVKVPVRSPPFPDRGSIGLPWREPGHGAAGAAGNEIRAIDRVERQRAWSEMEAHHCRHPWRYSGCGNRPRDGSVRNLDG